VDVFSSNIDAETNILIGVGPVDCQNCSTEVIALVNNLRKTISDQISKSPHIKVKALGDMDKYVESVGRGVAEPFEDWSLRIGQQTEIDKVVYITIIENEKKYVTDKIVRFKITVLVLDVKSRKQEIIQPVETELVEEFDKISMIAGDAIARIYHGNSEITEGNDSSVTLSYLYPQADLRDGGVGNGYGTNFNIYFLKPIWFLVTVGVYDFELEKDDINSLFMIPFGAHIPYYYTLTSNIGIIPSIGGGGLVSIMEYDKYRYRTPHVYKTEVFFNPLITARIETNYIIQNRYAFVGTPSLSYIVGKDDRIGLIFSFDIGFKIKF
jgi:hypothetical protein